MIFTILIYIFAIIISAFALILPSWSIWPPIFLAGLQYIFLAIAKWNIILPIDTFFDCITRLTDFAALYFTAWIVVMVFNFFRGSDGIKI